MTVEVAVTIAGLAFSGMLAAVTFAVRAAYAAGAAKEKVEHLSAKHAELATDLRPKVTRTEEERSHFREMLATLTAEVRALEKRVDREKDGE